MIITKNVWKSGIKVFFILLCLKIIQVVHSECRIGDWVCDDGQCIPINYSCDGKVDCSDRSDETEENCIKKICKKTAFRCKYGGCVNASDICNGVTNCADSSDEWICPENSGADFHHSCAAHEMQCLISKECIGKSLFCNGITNCKDGSDESPEVCLNLSCKGYQCANGACISEKLKCNGKAECLDGSDEAEQLCNIPQRIKNSFSLVSRTGVRFKRQATNCLLPRWPELKNVAFKLHPHNETVQLGQSVGNYETLYAECKNDGTLIGEKVLLCRNGDFTSDFPNCNYCGARHLNKLSIRSYCINNRVFQKCPDKISPGTSVRVICAFGYSRQPSNEVGLKCKPDGEFDQIVPSCKMNCGTLAHNLGELTRNGVQIEVSKAPWHVAIYEKVNVHYIYTCGGSIVSLRIIISAAHCFFDEANKIPKNSKNFQIIAGRNTSLYPTEETVNSQKANVEEVHISPDYQGRDGGQLHDIAFLKLKEPLEFSETILPICLDNIRDYSGSKYMQSNREGFVNGFGANNQLELVNMKTLDYHECKRRSPRNAPLVGDKFCAYANHDAFLCRGDSGGAFITGQTNEDTGVTTYKLWGVISNTPITNSECTGTGEQSYVAITNIFFAKSTFKEKLADAIKEDELLIIDYERPTVALRNISFAESTLTDERTEYNPFQNQRYSRFRNSTTKSKVFGPKIVSTRNSSHPWYTFWNSR